MKENQVRDFIFFTTLFPCSSSTATTFQLHQQRFLACCKGASLFHVKGLLRSQGYTSFTPEITDQLKHVQ
ncbi:hypothetical protein NC652_018195 [Populus alba x Populus x berolinensis]|nr:hypothetical protein NC652_018195 [Populus alba x Populus x berolinensis]